MLNRPCRAQHKCSREVRNRRRPNCTRYHHCSHYHLELPLRNFCPRYYHESSCLLQHRVRRWDRPQRHLHCRSAQRRRCQCACDDVRQRGLRHDYVATLDLLGNVLGSRFAKDAAVGLVVMAKSDGQTSRSMDSTEKSDDQTSRLTDSTEEPGNQISRSMGSTVPHRARPSVNCPACALSAKKGMTNPTRSPPRRQHLSRAKSCSAHALVLRFARCQLETGK